MRDEMFINIRRIPCRMSISIANTENLLIDLVQKRQVLADPESRRYRSVQQCQDKLTVPRLLELGHDPLSYASLINTLKVVRATTSSGLEVLAEQTEEARRTLVELSPLIMGQHDDMGTVLHTIHVKDGMISYHRMNGLPVEPSTTDYMIGQYSAAKYVGVTFPSFRGLQNRGLVPFYETKKMVTRDEKILSRPLIVAYLVKDLDKLKSNL
jgi:hypothetical protein